MTRIATDYERQLCAAVAGAVVHSITSFSWRGRRIEPLPKRVARTLEGATSRHYMKESLQLKLYHDFYCKNPDSHAEQVRRPGPKYRRVEFLDALEAADPGQPRWEHGWQIVKMLGPDLLVERNGLRVIATPGQYSLRPAGMKKRGGVVALQFPSGSHHLSPGFYTIAGAKRCEGGEPRTLLRFYCNLSLAAVVAVVGDVTRALAGEDLWYRIKVLSDPQQFARPDAVVLYTAKEDYDTVADVLMGAYKMGRFRTPVPVLTKALAPGIGLAENPGSKESFGMHRCGLIAEGLVRALEQRAESSEGRLEAVKQAFRDEGLDPARPYLNPGSVDEYLAFPTRSQYGSRDVADDSGPSREQLLTAAAGIADELCRDALWCGDRCTWIGPILGHATDLRSIGEFSLATIGPNLYDGTSGVALFLAYCHRLTGDRHQKRAALGAARQAVAHAVAETPPSAVGLFTGRAGIALAGAAIGIMLNDAGLARESVRLLTVGSSEPADYGDFDLISGGAGTIVAFLALSGLLDDASFLKQAVDLGEGLLESAVQSSDGMSWGPDRSPDCRNLTGMSHGAAGVASALLELFDATGQQEFRDAAMAARRYEGHWFDPTSGNWADLRTEGGSPENDGGELAFAISWCHGAPGIALSRLRACELLGDRTCRAEALVGVETTRRHVEERLRNGSPDVCLCHGLAGTVEVLYLGERTFGQELPEVPRSRMEATRLILSLREETRRDISPLVSSWDAPGLMIGKAGVGYFLLRLVEPTIPSVLLVRASDW